MKWLRDPLLRGRVVLALLAILLLSVATPFVLGTDARHLSAYQDADEDLSQFRDRLPGTTRAVLTTPATLLDVENPADALYVAIGPERGFDRAETAAIIDFLRRGGSVLLADETGHGDRIAYEAGFRFETNRLLDTNGYNQDPRFPIVQARIDESGRPYTVVFNLPTKLTALSNVGPHEVLARSSSAEFPEGSFIDVNGNGVIERGDAPGPHALIVRAPVGKGTLLLVADTGLFMNEQMRISERDGENAQYAKDLLATLAPRDGVVYIDESLHAQPAALAPWNDALRALGRATTGGVAPIILLILLAVGTYAAWYYTRETEDWSHHNFDVGRSVPAPEDVRPDLERLQRFARRRISERYNIPLEQVATMPAEELHSITGDRTLAEAAAGTLRSDPAPLFAQYAPSPSSAPEAT